MAMDEKPRRGGEGPADMVPKKVLAFHEGGGSQEGIFGELKTHCQIGYVPVRKRRESDLPVGRAVVTQSASRTANDDQRTVARHTQKRTPLGAFEELHTSPVDRNRGPIGRAPMARSHLQSVPVIGSKTVC